MPLITAILVSKIPTGEASLAPNRRRRLRQGRLTIEWVLLSYHGGVRNAINTILQSLSSVAP